MGRRRRSTEFFVRSLPRAGRRLMFLRRLRCAKKSYGSNYEKREQLSLYKTTNAPIIIPAEWTSRKMTENQKTFENTCIIPKSQKRNTSCQHNSTNLEDHCMSVEILSLLLVYSLSTHYLLITKNQWKHRFFAQLVVIWSEFTHKFTPRLFIINYVWLI